MESILWQSSLRITMHKYKKTEEEAENAACKHENRTRNATQIVKGCKE